MKDSYDGLDVEDKVCPPIKSTVCFMSIWNCFAVLIVLSAVVMIMYICKAYVRTVLIWLEMQGPIIVYITIVILFIIVSFPVSVGYIVLVLASGYLLGLLKGLILSVIGANLGLLVAHNLIKLVSRRSSVHFLIKSEIAKAIIRVISGPLCFRIVFCSRLTPIPFGLQNVIFALSDINGWLYHIASLLGLFPGQFVAVYVGSTLRSMQDVIENRHLSSSTYIFVTVQLVFGACLMLWLGTKARRELLRALAEAESKYNSSDRLVLSSSSFSIV